MIKDSYGNSRFFGIYRGVVFDTKDPLDKHRLRVLVPQLLANFPTEWAWPVHPVGATFVTPEIGQGVWVMFEGGDPSYPVWTGAFSELASLAGASTADLSAALKDAKAAAKKSVGAFHSTVSQTAVAINTPYAITCNVVDISDGVELTAGSRFTVTNAGIYNIQFSAQLDKTTNNIDQMYIWLRKNGVNVAMSNTAISLTKSEKTVPAWNFVVEASAGDYYELIWQVPDVGIYLPATAANTVPGVPSVIVTVTQV